MVKVEVEELLRAPIEAVFEQLTNHRRTTPASMAISSSTLTRTGERERNGAGAQRKAIRLRRRDLWEDIVAFERPTLLEYRIVKMRPPGGCGTCSGA